MALYLGINSIKGAPIVFFTSSYVYRCHSRLWHLPLRHRQFVVPELGGSLRQMIFGNRCPHGEELMLPLIIIMGLRRGHSHCCVQGATTSLHEFSPIQLVLCWSWPHWCWVMVMIVNNSHLCPCMWILNILSKLGRNRVTTLWLSRLQILIALRL